jgi:hypothetical protein
MLQGGTKAPRVLAVEDLPQRQCYSGIRITSILLRQNCLHTNDMSSVQHSNIILFVSQQCLTSQPVKELLSSLLSSAFYTAPMDKPYKVAHPSVPQSLWKHTLTNLSSLNNRHEPHRPPLNPLHTSQHQPNLDNRKLRTPDHNHAEPKNSNSILLSRHPCICELGICGRGKGVCDFCYRW